MVMPLEGIRVLDWTVFQQGPVATAMLGDLGADVIKIEDRAGGDPARGMVRVLGAQSGLKGRNAYFESNNRNKRSIALDLSKQQAREIIYKLTEKADVFVQNHRRGVAARRGLDYATLSKYNPRLIYATASGWGPKGPISDEPSFDYTGQARSGIMNVVGEPGMPPLWIGGGMGDQVGAILTVYGVLAALLVRERYGIGQEIDVSLLGSLLFLQGLNVGFTLLMDRKEFRATRAKAGNPLWNHYCCRDDKWLALAHLQPDRFWPPLCRALGKAELEKDPSFQDMEARSKNCEQLISILDKVFATRDRDEWLKILRANDVICAPINSMPEAVVDPQVLANEYVADFNHPVWGPVKLTGIPVIFSQTPGQLRREAPELGQHTEEILGEMGYSWDDISRLKEEEVIL